MDIENILNFNDESIYKLKDEDSLNGIVKLIGDEILEVLKALNYLMS